MAFLMGLPSAVPTPRFPTPPAGRYTRTNPLRREAGLRLLSESLPEPLRWAMMRAWRRPSRYSHTDQELPNPYQPRPDDAALLGKSPRVIGYLALIELELSRRVVEAPQARIRPVLRNSMLAEQSAYLRRLYDALARQIGETNALADFEGLIVSIV